MTMFDETTSVHETLKDKKDEEILFLSVKKPALFEVLIGRYQTPFLNKVRGILGNREEVEDIVQETFVKIYLNAARFKVQKGASFKSWGYKILLNTTFSHYQKLKKDDGALLRVEKEIYEAFPEKIDDVETYDYVASIISRMPTQLGRALKLHFLDGMPQKEIAALERISISAVKTRIYRAKREFKKVNKGLEK
ncbi:MAG: RNA polymerase sigma factor [Parcubacteria group bacterium]|nr:RNA polymerase sigma factor [Parcubacteria group bacterium]